jgi:hypothetical protein
MITRASRLAMLMGAVLWASACTPSTSTSQRLPIGNACATSGQCGTGAFYCDVGWPSGYCKAQCSSDASCPSGAVCVGADMLSSGACLLPCQVQSDCRAGYVCSGDTISSRMYCAAPVVNDLGNRD